MTLKKIKPLTKPLTPDPKNLRLHSQRNKDAIKQSLLDSGPFRSIAVDRDGIVRAGNGVFEQASELGYTVRVVDAAPGELIAVRRPDLFGRAAERAALADNRTTDLSEFDNLALAKLATDDAAMLKGLYDENEIAELARLVTQNNHPDGPGEQPFDQADSYQKKWGTEVEQVWSLNSVSVPGQKHYLFIGDCHEVDLSMAGEHVGLFTSPPYAEQRAAKYGGIAPGVYVKWFIDAATHLAPFLGHSGVILINIKNHCEAGERVMYTYELALALKKELQWLFIDEFVWVKPGYPGDMGKRFKNGFESIYQYAKSPDYKFRLENVVEYRQSNFGGYVENLQTIQGETGTDNSHDLSVVRPSNVLHIMPDVSTNESTGGHPARFPPALPEFFISAYSDKGDRWLDPFAGSGTTLVVCEQLGRLSTMIELMPKYGATVLERYEQYTGIRGELQESIPAPARKKELLSSRTVAKARLTQRKRGEVA